MKYFYGILVTIVLLSYYIFVYIKDRRSVASVCESYSYIDVTFHLGYLYQIWMTILAIVYGVYYILFIKDSVEIILMLLACNGISLMGSNAKLNNKRIRYKHDVGMMLSEVSIAIYVIYMGYQYVLIPAILVNIILCIISKRATINSIGILVGHFAIMARVFGLPSMY